MSDSSSDSTPPAEPAPAAIRGTSVPRRRRSRARTWAFRLLAMTLVPLLFLGVLELALRWAGSGQPTTFFLDRQIAGQQLRVENYRFGRRFFPPGLAREPLPVAFAPRKAPDTYRVFVLGESAAMGFPGPSFSFARILEKMLEHQYPERQFEVINVAMTAINSHVILPIARECADSDADLLVVYMGNNEVVGPYGAAGVLGPATPPLPLIRASIRAKATRIGQLFDRMILSAQTTQSTQAEWDGMTMFTESQLRASDQRLQRVYSQFERNLRDICSVGRAGGADVIVCTVASNLRSQPPFGSLASEGLDSEAAAQWQTLFDQGAVDQQAGRFVEALQRFREAEAIDDRRADLHYRLATCLLATGAEEEAREHYALARDLDTLRFRTDSRQNAIIRAVVDRLATDHVQLADVERASALASPHQVPGEEQFYEHVHMNFTGNYIVARTVFQQVARLLGESDSSVEPLSQTACQERLGYSDWNELNALQSVEMLLTRPPFSTQPDAQQRAAAVQQTMRELGARLGASGYAESVQGYQEALEHSPDDPILHMDLGFLLMSVGQLPEATQHFFEVQEALPHHPAPHIMLGHVFASQGQIERALAACDEALKLQPDSAQALELKNQLQAFLTQPRGQLPAEPR